MLINKSSVSNIFKILISILFSIIISVLLCEIILRVKHYFLVDYDIEMWRYSKELKVKSTNIKINHTHKKNGSSNLQKVQYKINKFGQRDKNFEKDDLNKFERSFIILGSSMALGWGVEQDKTFSSELNKISKKNNKNWFFVNGGIGNYNTERYVNNYLENWSELKFTDIIIHFFVNDTEVLSNKKANFFVEHSHVGVVIWKLINSYKSSFKKENLVDYYKKKYEENFEGFKIAENELSRLKKFCEKNEIKCHLIMMPDIHQLDPYELIFTNDKMKKISDKLGYEFLDLLPVLKNQPKEKIWNKYNDPHPNAYGHKLIADRIYEYLN